jgi:hypothetical protein
VDIVAGLNGVRVYRGFLIFWLLVSTGVAISCVMCFCWAWACFVRMVEGADVGIEKRVPSSGPRDRL